MPDRDELHRRLIDVGLTVSESELNRLNAAYLQVRRVLGDFVALGASRYEAPALSFQPPDELVDWGEDAP